jgi:amino acid transporter
MFIRRWVIGIPLATVQASRERLSKVVALAVFSSDALSSVAYATEEMLLVLVLAGSLALGWSLPLSLAIMLLLVILTVSYRQTIYAYPTGGGSYIVAKANLGELPGLTAAAALMIDYILTVSVSVSAGVAALSSALPALYRHRVGLALLAVGIVTVVNLRGIRESGRTFAGPTYLFIGSLFLMLLVGFGRFLLGGPPPAQAAEVPPPIAGLTLFLLLRAFSSGCTALTGVEAISNGVPAFRPPESKNAATTMAWVAAVLGTLFLGITILSHVYGLLPREGETLVSQLAWQVFGGGPLYYLVQAATMLILILASNTSFADFPRLASLLARDQYLPTQLAHRGDRLVFSNGILLLGIFSCVLIVIFRGSTHALIPLYAVGVFLSFTLSQAGMVRHWLVERGPHWRKSLLVNGLGAMATGLATCVLAVTKFTHGAWLVALVIPILILWFRTVHGHYGAVGDQLSLASYHRPLVPKHITVVLPISHVNRAVIPVLDYARSLGSDIRAVSVDLEPEETKQMKAQWEVWGGGVPLVILPSPYRSFLVPCLAYIGEIREKDPDGWVTVILSEVIPARWWQNLLHNQRALIIRAALLFTPGVVVTTVPYHLER